MERKVKFEFKRKFIHLFALLYLVIYYVLEKKYSHKIALLALIFIFVLLVVMEYFKIVRKKKIPLLNLFLRKKEEKKLGGEIYFSLGAIIVLGVFDFNIAVVVLLMTTFGDMAATLIGINFGKHYFKNSKKSWEGAVAEFFVDLAIGFIFLNNFWIILVMALTATLVEVFFNHIDDNLAIPVFSGFIAEVLYLFFN